MAAAKIWVVEASVPGAQVRVIVPGPGWTLMPVGSPGITPSVQSVEDEPMTRKKPRTRGTIGAETGTTRRRTLSTWPAPIHSVEFAQRYSTSKPLLRFSPSAQTMASCENSAVIGVSMPTEAGSSGSSSSPVVGRGGIARGALVRRRVPAIDRGVLFLQLEVDPVLNDGAPGDAEQLVRPAVIAQRDLHHRARQGAVAAPLAGPGDRGLPPGLAQRDLGQPLGPAVADGPRGTRRLSA